MKIWLSLKIRIVCGIESMDVEDGLSLQRGGGLQDNPTVRKAFQPSEPGAKGSRVPSSPLSYGAEPEMLSMENILQRPWQEAEDISGCCKTVLMMFQGEDCDWSCRTTTKPSSFVEDSIFLCKSCEWQLRKGRENWWGLQASEVPGASTASTRALSPFAQAALSPAAPTFLPFAAELKQVVSAGFF